MTDRPYTDDDVRDEAVLLGVALGCTPSVADLERSLPGQYVPSRRAEDGTGPTYGDLLDADGITALANAVHERITGGEARVAAFNEAAVFFESKGRAMNQFLGCQVSAVLRGFAAGGRIDTTTGETR